MFRLVVSLELLWKIVVCVVLEKKKRDAIKEKQSCPIRWQKQHIIYLNIFKPLEGNQLKV